MVADGSDEASQGLIAESCAGARSAGRRPAHFGTQGEVWSEQILDAAAEVVGEAIAKRQDSVRIEMREADAADDKGPNLPTRPDFVKQTSLEHIEVRVVSERHDLIGGNIVGAECGRLPVPHEFAKEVRSEARARIEPIIPGVADRQVVHVRRVEGDISAETGAQE